MRTQRYVVVEDKCVISATDEARQKSIESSFAQTRLDYIDLYLIHAPYGGKEARCGTWRALVEAQRVC